MFHMKIGNTIVRKVSILLAGATFIFSTACSSSQQDDEELEVSNEQNQQGNLGEDDAAEGNGQENVENEFENEQGNQQGNEQGADVNSETGNEFENENGGDEQMVNNTGENINPTLDNSAGANPAMNTAAPMNPATMAAPAPAPAPVASDRAPIPGGRVRYVTSTVQVVNAPGGAPVFTLETGDHPVTWEENGWLRISTGMYVPVDAMSDKGVARPMQGKGWN
jgi:hypothetical protein